MSKQSDAIRAYFDAKGVKNKYISEKLGLTPAVVCNMLAGRDKIGYKRAVQLSDAFGFSVQFLLTGEGELFPTSQTVGNGAIVNGGRVSGGINVTADLAAKEAEIAQLRRENERLWEMIQNLTKK